jgi:hypothetical protein
VITTTLSPFFTFSFVAMTWSFPAPA